MDSIKLSNILLINILMCFMCLKLCYLLDSVIKLYYFSNVCTACADGYYVYTDGTCKACITGC